MNWHEAKIEQKQKRICPSCIHSALQWQALAAKMKNERYSDADQACCHPMRPFRTQVLSFRLLEVLFLVPSYLSLMSVIPSTQLHSL